MSRPRRSLPSSPAELTLGVAGLGLIGGSVALAARRAWPGQTVLGYDQRASECELALERGAVCEIAANLADLARRSTLLVLAVPVRAVAAVLAEIPPEHRERLLFTDVGSVKGVVREAFLSVFGTVPAGFLAAHPIAGSERSGMAAARADLFDAHRIIISPERGMPERVIGLLSQFWRDLGGEVVRMRADHHDEVLAATSHLPHLLAFTLVDTLASQSENLDIFRYAAGGFRDFTRIAASDAIMWRDIFLTNKQPVLKVLDDFSQALEGVRKAIVHGDEARLTGVFSRARTAREHFSKILEQKSYNAMSEQLRITYRGLGGRPLTGTIRVPGDKSMSHRSIMLGALAIGETRIEGFLEGEDALATIQAFRDMGVAIEGPDRGSVRVFGVGMRGLQAPAGPLYLGNSGTSMRLLAGLLAAQSFPVEMTGDTSLSRRPMERVAAPLRDMGARIETAEKGRPPLRISPVDRLRGIHYTLPVASAQIKSALLLAGLYAEGETQVTEPAPVRDHTERMLRGFGYPVSTEGPSASLRGGGQLQACAIDLPSDISSAAFFLVAASILPGSDLTLTHVGINPTRVGVLKILEAMGADLTLSNEREIGGEPVADIRVRHARLRGIDIPEDWVPLAIDEFPVLFVAAACAEGRTRLTGAEELRVKESDRIQSMADGLQSLGIACEPLADGMIIDGAGGDATVFLGGVTESHGDHRIAMAFAVASLRARDTIRIKDCANVATSFPGFLHLANSIGFNLSEEHEQSE